MGSKIVTLTCMIFFISNNIVYTAGDATMVSMIKSLKDTQELLDAYNDRDSIKMGIKLIDVKLKVDPPEKDSREEQLLLSCRNQLVKMYPYYLKIHKAVKNKPTAEDIRNLQYEDIIEQAIDTLDGIIYEMGMAMDNLQHYSTTKPLRFELQENNAVPLMNNATEQLSNFFNSFPGQVANVFSEAVHSFL